MMYDPCRDPSLLQRKRPACANLFSASAESYHHISGLRLTSVGLRLTSMQRPLNDCEFSTSHKYS